MMNGLFIKTNSETLHAGLLAWPRACRLYAITAAIGLICAVNVKAQDNHQAVTSKQAAPLRLGLLPHLSSNLLMKKYRHLITYLETQLQRPVIVHTAPDYKTYIKRAAQGRYDLYLTAPHMAAYHEAQNKHQRVAGFNKPLRGVIVVAVDSPYRRLADLKGKVVTSPDVLSAVTLLGEVTFMRKGIDAQKEIILKYTPTHNNALLSVVEGKANAAIAGLPALKIFTSKSRFKKSLRILAKTQAVPQMMFMSPGRVSKEVRDTFKKVLLNINKDKTGKTFVDGVPFGSFSSISDKQMRRLSDMLLLLERRL